MELRNRADDYTHAVLPDAKFGGGGVSVVPVGPLMQTLYPKLQEFYDEIDMACDRSINVLNANGGLCEGRIESFGTARLASPPEAPKG